MLKWIKNKFLTDTLKEVSHEEEIIQETIVDRDSIDIGSEQNERDEKSQSVVQQQVDTGGEVRNESNNLEQRKQNYQREFSSLFLIEETKEEVVKLKPKPKPKPKPTKKSPFKPTRVPSPIYGFNPRPGAEKKEEIITPKKIVKETAIQIVEELESKQKKEEFIVETNEKVRNSKEEQPKTKERIVPYNVIMRQQDRRKMKKVREQKEK